MCYTCSMRFFQQSHFLGVLPPDDLALTLEDCRRFMSQRYGCKSGHGTPVHVTLVPPFLLPNEFSTDDIFCGLQNALRKGNLPPAFTATVAGFDAFGDRTIFARVQASSQWNRLRDEVLANLLSVAPGCTRKDARPFQPHLTVANRDIPSGASAEALEVLGQLELPETFPVDNITVFERVTSRWMVAGSLEL